MPVLSPEMTVVGVTLSVPAGLLAVAFVAAYTFTEPAPPGLELP